MKRSTSFRLSDEARDGLRQLADVYGFSQAAALEKLILDRASSSDRMKNTLRRQYACDQVLEHSSLSDRGIFFAGYNRGWYDFQTRHSDESMIEALPTD